MNAATRERLRAAVDHAQRQRLMNIDTTGLRCGRCGVELEGRTRGCKACADRHCHRRLRRKKTS